MEGALGREERRELFKASMTANLMNSTGNYKKPITAAMLLGLEKPEEEGMSREAIQAMFDARKDPNWKFPDDVPRVIRADGSRVE